MKKDRYDKKEKKAKFENDERNEKYKDIVVGRNAVRELIKSGHDINKVWIQKGLHGMDNIVDELKDSGVPVMFVEREKLDKISNKHMGIIASVPPFSYVEIEDILEYAEKRNEMPFVVILDKIEDPHNLGAIIRSGVCAGAHGIIIPKRNAAQVNETVFKSSAGAVSKMKIARVSNVRDCINELKEKGLWVISSTLDAETPYYDQSYDMPIALIIGNEEKGVSKLIQDESDIKIKIPMKSDFDSLNASVSAGIMMFEILKNRENKKIDKK